MCTYTPTNHQPSTKQRHKIMGLLRKLLGRKPKAPKGKSPPAAGEAATYTSPNPFPDEETFAAVKAHVLARARQNANNPEYLAMQKMIAFSTPTTWLEANYPPEQFHLITEMGPLPTDSGEGVRVDTDTLIPCDDTMFYMVSKHNPKGEKPAEVKMLFFVAIPPKGCGGEFAGTPMAYDTLGTDAMKAVEREVLWFVRKWQQEGPEGKRPEDGVRVVVQMGMDMLIWEYSREKGFHDPEGGFEVKEVRDEGRWERDGMRMPPAVEG
ncbi:hypothetical protein QBC36DRAFT_346265 [Triangularia setosa]|uniref:Uncharacterized protein n=1 Tax=Triangularia setosa TaxID=2587417 RepID=A0AAN6W7G8_9PEZI|nr:hypothetical protein QBC36DRAFT_346265 [Podospora setosa]